MGFVFIVVVKIRVAESTVAKIVGSEVGVWSASFLVARMILDSIWSEKFLAAIFANESSFAL